MAIGHAYTIINAVFIYLTMLAIWCVCTCNHNMTMYNAHIPVVLYVLLCIFYCIVCYFCNKVYLCYCMMQPLMIMHVHVTPLYVQVRASYFTARPGRTLFTQHLMQQHKMQHTLFQRPHFWGDTLPLPNQTDLKIWKHQAKTQVLNIFPSSNPRMRVWGVYH